MRSMWAAMNPFRNSNRRFRMTQSGRIRSVGGLPGREPSLLKPLKLYHLPDEIQLAEAADEWALGRPPFPFRTSQPPYLKYSGCLGSETRDFFWAHLLVRLSSLTRSCLPHTALISTWCLDKEKWPTCYLRDIFPRVIKRKGKNVKLKLYDVFITTPCRSLLILFHGALFFTWTVYLGAGLMGGPPGRRRHLSPLGGDWKISAHHRTEIRKLHWFCWLQELNNIMKMLNLWD